jgi:hypothetical protein
MELRNCLSSKQKCLKVNLDPDIYGTFAEIGAGQEVARYFFQAGGASGTIAKTMSAYDMVFSDTIYGKEESGRYVSKSRVEKMLEREYKLIIDRLSGSRKNTSKYFAFANTVATRSFGSKNTRSHGWMGMRFQHESEAECSEVIMHVKMLDGQNVFQQEALGVVGVNVVHGCFFEADNYENFLDSLIENLNADRIEINMLFCNGPAFKNWDNRIINLELVKRGYTKAVMFDENGKVILPADELYKKNVQLVRGSFRPPTLVNLDMINKGKVNFSRSENINEDDITLVAEITINNLSSAGLSPEDFLARVDLIGSLNQKVLISNFTQYYHLTEFLSSLNPKCLGLVLGGVNFSQIFDEDYLGKDIGLFTALGLLFKRNIKLFVYPFKDMEGGNSIDVYNLKLPEQYNHLYQYLLQNEFILPMENYDESILHIYSKKVLIMIEQGDRKWEEMVPPSVRDLIKERGYFGYSR